MSLNTTTVSSAVGQTDTSIVVASATGVAAGSFAVLDQEVMQVSKNYSTGTTIPVQRGLDGSVQTTHKASANITFYLGSDEAIAAVNVVQFPKVRGRDHLSYSAAGAITLPTPGNDMIAVINGTGALAMTLANPTKDMDGCMLYIIANGKAAHTVTYTAGVGNGDDVEHAAVHVLGRIRQSHG